MTSLTSTLTQISNSGETQSGNSDTASPNDSLETNHNPQICEKSKEEEFTLYNLPKYYDIAFSRDVSGEIAFYINCFKKYCTFEVERILEPACGSGIFLEAFPKYGYHITGYDVCPNMVDYTRQRIINNGAAGKAEVLLGDMRTTRFKEKFDAAIISINSLGYCLTDKDIISHFKAMSESLRKGGLYVVEIVCAYEDLKNEQKPDETWLAENNGTNIEATWCPYFYDRENKIRYIDFRMKVQDNGRMLEFNEKHKLRLWLYEDFVKPTREAGFRLEAIYNQEYQLIPKNSRISGELGALYYVLINE